MVEAAGLFLVRKDNKFLVGHPTRHKPNFWGIPKGKVEADEPKRDAAIRETFEETNVDVSDWEVMHTLEPVKYTKTKKILYPFVVFEAENPFDFDSFELKCNSFVPEEKGGFPEMDAYKWVTLDEAKDIMHESQVACLSAIEALITRFSKKN